MNSVLTRIRSNPILLALTGLLVVAALAFAWWTISPLFIRTTLVEGQDIALPAATQGAGAMEKPSEAAGEMMEKASPTAEAMMEKPAETPAAAMEKPADGAMASTDGGAQDKPADAAMMDAKGPQVLGVGNFDRKDDVHYANGQAILARQEDGSTAVRLQELDAANGPDLYVYASEHPNPTKSEELNTGGYNLGTLKATTGSFSYTLDPSIDPSKIKSVVIYCKAFSVIFSVAALQPAR